MDGQILANSLVSLKGTDLRLVYALLMKTNIGHLLTSKTKEFFSKEDKDHFSKHLLEEVEKLEEEDAVLQVELFLELTKLLKLKGTKYSLQKEIEDQCEWIVSGIYQEFQRQDKQFRTFSENHSDASKLQQIVQFQMTKVFQELDDSFTDFSIEDQTKFATQVNEFIQSLPEEKQMKIKEKLGMDDLTDEMVRKAIATSGASIVFAIIVEVSGFAFYTTATSLVASFAGLLGITLPFGFYTGLTSTIAVLASPFFVIPLLLGGGVLLVNQQNQSLKKKLLPIILMQITLPYMSNGEGDLAYESFIAEWNRRYEGAKLIQSELNRLEQSQKETKVLMKETEQQMKKCVKHIKKEMEKIMLRKEDIKSSLKSTPLNTIDVSPSFEAHYLEYKELRAKIKELRLANENRPAATSFFNKIGKALKSISTSMDIREEEKKLDALYDKMVNDVILSTSSFKQKEREQITESEKLLSQLRAEKKSAESEKQRLESILSRLEDEFRSYIRRKKQLEKDNYGLEDIL